jgi:hypothetical protein
MAASNESGKACIQHIHVAIVLWQGIHMAIDQGLHWQVDTRPMAPLWLMGVRVLVASLCRASGRGPADNDWW